MTLITDARARGTHTAYARACYYNFFFPQAYYWLRISYQNHARLNRVEGVQ